MEITPRNSYVLVELIPDTEQTSSGFILSSNANGKQAGTILSVGKFVDDLKAGDKVLFKKYMGDSVEIETDGQMHDEIFVIVEDSDIVATYK